MLAGGRVDCPARVRRRFRGVRLSELFAGEQPLTFAVASSNPRLASVHLANGVLTVRSDADYGEDGDAVVTVTATDVNGLTTTVTFDVVVRAALSRNPVHGWLGAWIEAQRQAGEEATMGTSQFPYGMPRDRAKSRSDHTAFE